MIVTGSYNIDTAVIMLTQLCKKFSYSYEVLTKMFFCYNRKMVYDNRGFESDDLGNRTTNNERRESISTLEFKRSPNKVEECFKQFD